MQSLQADQSLYNRKGVCNISLSIGHFSGVKNTCILNRDRKYNKNINNSGQNQLKRIKSGPKREKRGKWRDIALCNDEKGDSNGIISLLLE